MPLPIGPLFSRVKTYVAIRVSVRSLSLSKLTGRGGESRAVPSASYTGNCFRAVRPVLVAEGCGLGFLLSTLL